MSSKVLTVEQVLDKSKCQKPEEVMRVNLWAQGIEDVSCVSQFSNLRIITLTGNKISSLTPFASCSHLQELYLRKNKLSDFNEIQKLANLRELRVLWISENPIASALNYRTDVIRMLPQLYKLDEHNVTAEERMEALGTKDGMAVQELLAKEKQGVWEDEQKHASKERQLFKDNASNNILGIDVKSGLKFSDSINLKVINMDSTVKEPEESSIWK